MSTPMSPPDRYRQGFSLLEILVVLAIFAISTAVVMPTMSRMLDQATAHAVFFDFQKQISDLRREANRTGIPIRVVDPAEATGDSDEVGDEVQVITLREPWRYTVAPSLEIAEGGVCSPATVNLLNGDSVVMTLRAIDSDCRFIRLQ